LKEQFYKWWLENGQRGRDYCLENCPIEGLTRWKVQEYLKEFNQDDAEITEYSTVLAQKVQKFQDTNRIERKAFRENARISNALEEYNKAIVDNISKLKPYTIVQDKLNHKAVGLIQISDAHFNELINIEGNKYDFEVAAQRLKLLATRAKQYFKSSYVSNILIAFTGDLMNSDRRLDEKLNQATNRGKATLLAFHLLEQFICDLNKHFNVSIASVSGNESRANEEMGYSEIIATDNYDFTIFNMLKVAFRGSKGVQFIEGDNSEKVVKIANSNILLLHGLSIKQDIEKSIQQIIGKYATKGIIIDYVFIGHIHSARVGDLYARSSSICGANAYSDFALNLASRASQNIAIFYENKSHDVIKVDLQNTDGIEGYQIIKELEAYNAKSVNKCKVNVPIFEVVI